MRTKITVTRKHIKNGSPGEPADCPVALAVRDIVYDGVRVTDRTIFQICGPDYHMPRSVQRFIQKFDVMNNKERRTLKPFSFFLRKKIGK